MFSKRQKNDDGDDDDATWNYNSIYWSYIRKRRWKSLLSEIKTRTVVGIFSLMHGWKFVFMTMPCWKINNK